MNLWKFDDHSNSRMNQLCKVCGEPAAGFHFGAFTCEGCKSFFGRTYNNLSQIHECKNGGSCIINKQNRTSCKACRLRKCLIVGMSKSGSRYGRRSNWFKIHCLLQEQASFSNQTTAFRTPATPTLQDGSLPFVATHLRDPLTGLDLGGDITTSGPIASQSPTSEIPSSCGMTDITRLPTTYSSSFSPDSLRHTERKIPDPLLCGPPLPSQTPIDPSYRERLIHFIQRSQGIDPLLAHPRQDHFDSGHTNIENSLGPMAYLEWKKRRREAHKQSDSDPDFDRRTSSCSPTKDTADSGDERKDEGRSVSPDFDRKLRTSQSLENLVSATDRHEVLTKDSKELKSESSTTAKNCEEERLSFMKNFAMPFNNFGRLNPAFRFPGREDLLYNPVNNNILSFPPYPPLWPTMIPFSPLSKFYSPFCSPRMQSPSQSINPESLKQPPLFLEAPKVPKSEIPKREDPTIKKRNLDAILQFQRESRNPEEDTSEIPTTDPSLGRSLVSLSQEVFSSTEGSSDQPMDLTVRRKRKMDKSEIVYKPGENACGSDNGSDPEAEARDNGSDPEGESHDSPDLEKQKYEVPLKILKLESTSETVAV